MKQKIFAALLAISSSAANAGQYCQNEKITQILLGSSTGAIIFKTDKSCTAGCKIRESWAPDLINKTYSMFLSAQAQNAGLTMYWEGHTSPCQGVVSEGTSPALVALE